jgi:hypothetical protein
LKRWRRRRVFRFDEGCALEAKLFGECLYSTQCQALIHAFFAERAVSKIPGIPAGHSGCGKSVARR